jgi:hypothetical protein
MLKIEIFLVTNERYRPDSHEPTAYLTWIDYGTGCCNQAPIFSPDHLARTWKTIEGRLARHLGWRPPTDPLPEGLPEPPAAGA